MKKEIQKLDRNENSSAKNLIEICAALDCGVCGIMKVVRGR